MKKVIIALVVICAMCSVNAYDPFDIANNITRGFFMQFQRDVTNTTGCYAVINGIYASVSTIIVSFKDFKMNNLPKIVAAITDVIYRCISLDEPCKIIQVINGIKELIEHTELIKKRATAFVILTFLNSLQKGILSGDFEALGKSVGFLMRSLLEFQI